MEVLQGSLLGGVLEVSFSLRRSAWFCKRFNFWSFQPGKSSQPFLRTAVPLSSFSLPGHLSWPLLPAGDVFLLALKRCRAAMWG